MGAAGNYQLLPGSPCIDKGYNQAIDTSITTDIMGNVRIYNAIIDFGAYEFNGNTPLATELISFTGQAINTNSNLLQWQVNASEVIRIALQRSGDGKVYNDIYSITHSGSGLEQYSYTDLLPLTSNFYRIQMTKANGAIQFSDVVYIGSKAAPVNLKVYPNPTNGSLNIIIGDESLLNTTSGLCDLSGRTIKIIRIESKSQNVSLSDIPAGIYLLKMQNGETAKIVKQ